MTTVSVSVSIVFPCRSLTAYSMRTFAGVTSCRLNSVTSAVVVCPCGTSLLSAAMFRFMSKRTFFDSISITVGTSLLSLFASTVIWPTYTSGLYSIFLSGNELTKFRSTICVWPGFNENSGLLTCTRSPRPNVCILNGISFCPVFITLIGFVIDSPSFSSTLIICWSVSNAFASKPGGVRSCFERNRLTPSSAARNIMTMNSENSLLDGEVCCAGPRYMLLTLPSGVLTFS